MTGRSGRWSMVVWVLAGVAVVAGCTSGSEARGPYARELEQAKADATSDFEREVFGDLRIDRGEYEEAVQRYLACAKGQGVTMDAELAPQTGLFQFSYVNPGVDRGSQTSTDADRVVDECRVGTVALIEPLYSDMRMNPQKVDLLQVAAECLVKRGVVPSGFSKTNLAHAMEPGSTELSGIDKEVLSDCMTPPGLRSSEGDG